MNAVRDLAWINDRKDVRRLAPNRLYGLRKMTAAVRRTSLPVTSRGAVHRAMKTWGLQGIRRGSAVRTTIPAKDGVRAGDLLNRGVRRAGAQPHLGRGLHLSPHMGRVRICRVHRGRVRPADRGLA